MAPLLPPPRVSAPDQLAWRVAPPASSVPYRMPSPNHCPVYRLLPPLRAGKRGGQEFGRWGPGERNLERLLVANLLRCPVAEPLVAQPMWLNWATLAAGPVRSEAMQSP